MRYFLPSVLMAGWFVGSVGAAELPVLKDQKATNSYSIGVNFGTSWKNQGIEVDYDALVRGLKDGMDGKTPLMTQEQMREALNNYGKELRAKAEEKRKLQGEKNKKEGETFLAENKNKPGIITRPSGLQYKVITEGKGEIPKSNDIVIVNYRGTLLDGTEFDNSYKRNQPAKFSASGVIKGWSEALQAMKTGSKWQLFIPSNLAYGEQGGRPPIGPNATLVFEVELVGIQPPAAPVTAHPTNAPVTSDIISVPSAEEMKKGAKIEIIKKEDAEKRAQEKK